MRILVAGILGGIVMFAWSAVSHTVLPIGEAGFKQPVQQEAVLDAIAASTTGEGLYLYPSLAPEQWDDAATLQAFSEHNRDKPYAFVVFQPGGNPVNQSMTPNLARQFAGDVLAALVLAWVLAIGAWGFGRRVLVAGALGLFTWLSLSVPYWNWYMFPASFTLGSLAGQLVGWSLAGAAMAWWLGRGAKAAG